MTFAWTGEISAPPTRRPLRPHSSSSFPAKSPGGFLKIEPAFGCFGSASLRLAATSARRAAISSAGFGTRRRVAPETMSSVSQNEVQR